MNLSIVLIPALLLAAAAEPVPSAAQDEARIEALVLAELSGAPAVAKAADTEAPVIRPSKAVSQSAETLKAQPGDLIAFDDLRQMLGRTVRFTTKSGHSHVAVVDAVSGGTVRLQVRMAGGQATYSLERGQIARITRI